MKKEILPIVITGHIDHGKSTLIGRLLYETNSLSKEKLKEINAVSKELGVDAGFAFFSDQLKEERDKMMTIDTTQVFFNSRKRSYCIIDTPGHAQFLKNMITGASYAQAAVLVVDAKEGVMDQTRRHLYVIQLLAIKQVIVVFNKMDLVNYDEGEFQRARDRLLAILKNIQMEAAVILPISAKENDNISCRTVKAKWFKGPSLIEALDSLGAGFFKESQPFCLPVQDVYTTEDRRIIVGRVSSGNLWPGRKIKIFPDFQEATIDRIIGFDKKAKSSARTGENVGLSLKEPSQVRRGQVFLDKDSRLKPVTDFEGSIIWLSSTPLNINSSLTLFCSTQSVSCVAFKIKKRFDTATLSIIEDAGEVKENEAACVSFRTEKPIVLSELSFIAELGRFMIESNGCIQAAGIVLKEPE